MNQKMITQASNQSNNNSAKYVLCSAESVYDYAALDGNHLEVNDYPYTYDYDLSGNTRNDSSQTEEDEGNSLLTLIVFLIVYVIQGCIFGYATKKIIENKRYQENWFWWGFFFGIIALLVALSKPELHSTYEEQSFLHGLTEDRIMREGGWECAYCHRKNEGIITTCSCGKSKDETEEKIKKQKEAQNASQSPKNNSEINTIELLEKYKKLLDSGALTQEEFDAKKKQLLS